MWLAHEQYQLIWEERQGDMQREAAKMRLVALALDARRQQGQTLRLPQVAAKVWQAAFDRLRPQPPAEPCCAPVE